MSCEAQTFKGWLSEEKGDQHAKYQDPGKNMADVSNWKRAKGPVGERREAGVSAEEPGQAGKREDEESDGPGLGTSINWSGAKHCPQQRYTTGRWAGDMCPVIREEGGLVV